MDYILGGLCIAPGMPDVTDVPIKLWVRYMPDTVEHIMRGLYLPREVFFDSVLEPPASSAAELPPSVRDGGSSSNYPIIS
jgi:hypothetical protein